MDSGPALVDLPLPALLARLESLGHPAFRARQLFRQLHHRRARSLDAMTELPAALRQDLASIPLAALAVRDVRTSSDGTEKLLLETRDGRPVETVLIPMEGGTATQCLSSQSGCAMGCAFCLTGRMGHVRNLTPGEIVDQHYLGLARGGRPIRNLVFMGMGEPLQNFENVRDAVGILEHELGAALSPRRITISTCGVLPGIRRMAAGEIPALLAISLNAPSDEIRSRIMPINRRYPLADLLDELKRYPLPPRLRHTFEYVLLRGVNDSVEHARELVRLLSHLRCKVNLIVFNESPGVPFQSPEPDAVEAFRGLLERKHFTVTVRQSRGRDILAACGQLAAAHAPPATGGGDS